LSLLAKISRGIIDFAVIQGLKGANSLTCDLIPAHIGDNVKKRIAFVASQGLIDSNSLAYDMISICIGGNGKKKLNLYSVSHQ